MAKKWMQGGDWHTLDEEGKPINLNTAAAAAYLQYLLERIKELESRKTSSRRKKPGPSETKREK